MLRLSIKRNRPRRLRDSTSFTFKLSSSWFGWRQWCKWSQARQEPTARWYWLVDRHQDRQGTSPDRCDWV